ncbi:ATP-dependent sacrificial sulfur transferase LarE [Anaerococcus murdochii]|uniref:ATP-dependent sacrificial sulfur transferase LarE n=1 Tax=Anaerococcus murdochii TaxID=411577 RepID=A0ABS7SXT6_9FIRM|nr:ATP-dependent sacrificial sulfur transferase LarE [Anaerococcus murdochii]MBZ2386354.1 ATP-dependent sacrificial sulfur transferase LarE [Anaerococcus murdochii]
MENSSKKLYDIIENLLKEKVVLAFSGGVDSALLLKIASSLRKDENDVVAMFFKAPSSTEEDLVNAKNLAEEMGVKLFIKDVDIFVDDHIVNNSKDRCYHCKSHLFKQAIKLKDDLGYGYVIDGTNTDDHKVYRPGLMALRDLGVVSPLNIAGFSKQMVRDLADELNISVAKRPSAPCLLTRFPYGTKITPAKLDRLEKAEAFIRDLGFIKFRVRDHSNIARIELTPEDFMAFIEKKDQVIKEFKSLGFSYVTLDLEGFRSGSMDEGLSEEEKKKWVL